MPIRQVGPVVRKMLDSTVYGLIAAAVLAVVQSFWIELHEVMVFPIPIWIVFALTVVICLAWGVTRRREAAKRKPSNGHEQGKIEVHHGGALWFAGLLADPVTGQLLPGELEVNGPICLGCASDMMEVAVDVAGDRSYRLQCPGCGCRLDTGKRLRALKGEVRLKAKGLLRQPAHLKA